MVETDERRKPLSVPARETPLCKGAVDPAEWDKCVLNAKGCVFHTHPWITFSSRNSGSKSLFFSWPRAGSISPLAVGAAKRETFGRVPLLKSLYFGSLPAGDSGGGVEQVRDLLAFARREGYAKLQINTFGTPVDLSGLVHDGFQLSRRWEFLLDLDRTEDEIWRSFHSKKRNLIRKAEKENVRVERSDRPEDLRIFRSLAEATEERKRVKGVRFPAPAPESYYRLMHKHVVSAGLGRLYLACRDDVCIAGAFCVSFAGRSYYLLSGSSAAGLELSAPDLLLWRAIRDFRNEGCESFNFGGVSQEELGGRPLEESGLYHFKIRFSPTVVPTHKGAINLKPRVLQALSMARRTLRSSPAQ